MNKLLAIICISLCVIQIYCSSCTVSDPQKVDCGYVGITQDECQNKGCCWQEEDNSDFRKLLGKKTNLKKNNGVPWCFYPVTDYCSSMKLESDTPGFDTPSYQGMYTNFINNLNIQSKGGVAASPDTQTTIGSYFYDWMRDESLSMQAYMNLNDNDYSTVVSMMKNYVQWVLHEQSLTDPYSIDIRSEPKYNLPNGDVWIGGWCRPQSDGPALRSRTLMQFASIIAKQEPSYVSQYLWTSNQSTYNGGAIKYDLDFLLNTYSMQTCDLWEDLQSYDLFWNRMAYVDALTQGYQFALAQGDIVSATKYHNTAYSINQTITNHWTGSIMAEDVTNRQVDGAVLHSFLTFSTIPIYSYYVSQTLTNYLPTYCSLYPINSADIQNNIPGILVGRYVTDVYCGGNPWQLLSAATAHLFYKLSKYMLDRGDVTVDESEISHWRGVLSLSEKPTAREVATASLSAGDSILYRVHYHVQDSSYMVSEQIDKNSGEQISAKGLTWSYANILAALHYRSTQLSELSSYKIDVTVK